MLTVRKIGPLHIKAVENAKNGRVHCVFHRTFMSGVARPSRCLIFRILRIDYLPRRSRGAGLHVAKEMSLVRRTGPNGSLTPRTVTILTQSGFPVNVVLHKHVCCLNMFAEIDLLHLEPVICV